MTQGERHTIFLCWLFVHSQLSTRWLNQRAYAPHSPQTHWPRPGPKKPTRFHLSPNLNSMLFFKITKNPSQSLPGMTSFTSPVTFPIWGFYCDICDCHILHLTNPNDKIYKMKNDNIKKKSFCNYITERQSYEY